MDYVVLSIKYLPKASPVAQMVKGLSTMRETQVQSLGREDPLEKEIAIHSSTIAWKIPWTEDLGRLQSIGSQKVGHDWATFWIFQNHKILKKYQPFIDVNLELMCPASQRSGLENNFLTQSISEVSEFLKSKEQR